MADRRYPWLPRDAPFTPSLLFRRPDFASFDRAGDRKPVCVIGGGVAGLAAAYELTRLRHPVTVLEASARLGGRIRTERFGDGSYAELGAMRIPYDHVGVRQYARLLGLRKRRFVPSNTLNWYHFRGGPPVRIASWVVAATKYPDLRVRYLRRPDLVLGERLKVFASFVDDSSTWWALYNGDLDDETFKYFDRVSLYQAFVTGTRLPIPPIALFAPEEWTWIGRATGMLWFEAASLLEHVVEVTSLQSATMFELVGGMDGLITRFESSLPPGSIEREARVTEIRMVDGGVEVTWSGRAGPQTRSFKYVICTAPASATSRIRFLPDGLPPSTSEALTGITYESAAKSVVHCRHRVWELAGAAGGGSFTDLPIQQCWYPSDNATPVLDERGEAAWPFETGLSQDLGVRRKARPAAWRPKADAVRDGPGAFVAAYMWGSNARRFLALSPAGRDQVVLKCLEDLHPGIGPEIDDIRHIAWDAQENIGQGAFAFFRPGEFSRYQRALCQPLPAGNPKVFFAGEHLGVLHAWIQSAILTSWAAVYSVIRS